MSSQLSGSTPAVPSDAFTLFGWLALFDTLRLIGERDPGFRREIDSAAVAEFVGHRRDALLHHHFPQFAA